LEGHNLKSLLRRLAEALYYIGFEACPRNVNVTHVQELYFEVEQVLNGRKEASPETAATALSRVKACGSGLNQLVRRSHLPQPVKTGFRRSGRGREASE